MIFFYCPTFTFFASLVSIKWQLFLELIGISLVLMRWNFFFFNFLVIELPLLCYFLCVSNTSPSIWQSSVYGSITIEKGGKAYADSVCSFLRAGPKEAGSGHYGSRYTMGVGEDDEFEDYLNLDVSFEEVTRISAHKTWVFLFSCWTRQFNQWTMNILPKTYLNWPICS